VIARDQEESAMSGRHRGGSSRSQLTNEDAAGRRSAGGHAKRKREDDQDEQAPRQQQQQDHRGGGDFAHRSAQLLAEELERQFSHRYTSRDTEYAKLAAQPRSQPPILYPW